MRKIDLENGLPKWPGDDIAWVCQKMSKQTAMNIADIVRALDFEPHGLNGQPSAIYFRVRAALHGAEKAGCARRIGRLWQLTCEQGPKAARAARA